MRRRRRVIGPRLDDWIEQRLASMWSFGEIVDAGVEEFGCNESTIARAIAAARQRWMRSEHETVDVRRAKFRAELEHAWRRALEAGDYRAVAVMARTRADIEGIKAPKKLEHSGVLGLRPVAAMSPQERNREIELLLAKRQAAMSKAGAGAELHLQDDERAAVGVAIGAAAIDEPTIDAPPLRPRRAKRRVPKRRVH